MSQELSAYVAFYGTAVSIIRPAIIAALLIGLWAALRRTDLPPGHADKNLAGGRFAAGRLVRFHLERRRRRRIRSTPRRTAILPVAIVLPIIIALPLLTRSQRIAAAIDTAPASWLIGLQVYRVIGGNFLVLWAYGGAIPGAFALPAGLGDVFDGSARAAGRALSRVGGAPHGRTVGDRLEFSSVSQI